MPTVLAGDLNMERDQEEGDVLSSHFITGIGGFSLHVPTDCGAQWDSKARSVWGETIDDISLFKSTQSQGIRVPAAGWKYDFRKLPSCRGFWWALTIRKQLFRTTSGLIGVIKGLANLKSMFYFLWNIEFKIQTHTLLRKMENISDDHSSVANGELICKSIKRMLPLLVRYSITCINYRGNGKEEIAIMIPMTPGFQFPIPGPIPTPR